MPLILKRPWTSQPQVALPVRPELRPIGGIQPGAFGTLDTSSQPLVIGTGIARAGGALDFGASNTGLTRTVSASYPLTLVFRGTIRTSTNHIVSSIATAADKLVRVYGFDGTAVANHIGGTTSAAATTAGFWNFGRSFTLVAVFESATMVRIYGAGTAGRASASNTTDIGSLIPLTKLSYGVYDGSVKIWPQDGLTELAQWLNYAPSPAEAWSWVDNPWLLFAPLPRRIWAPVASGVVTHATSGALTGDPATLSGTAAHIAVHGSTGALAGAGSTLAGTAAHIVVHSSTGALAGAGATAAGTAARLRAMATSGALLGGGATITGAAARAAAGVHDASGSLAAGGAALAGTAARIAPHATTGALAGAGATLAGTAAHVATHTTTGALVGAAAIVAGTAAHKVVHAVNGILVGGGAALTGMASRPAPASVSVSSAIGGPASSLFAELRGEVQFPSTRAAQANWERFISSVKPTRID